MFEEIDEEQVYAEFNKLLIDTWNEYQEIKNIKYPQMEIFIDDKVWDNTVKYDRMIRITKQKFFECLQNNVPLNEYEKEITKLWESIDHTYMDKAIEELQKMVIQQDFKNAEMYGNKKITERSIKLENSYKEYKPTDVELYKLTPEQDFRILERRYVNRHIKLYKNTKNRFKNSNDLFRDLANFMKTYDKLDKTIPYFSHSTGDIIRYVDVSTYSSMLYNTNLTRSAWNRAIYDAKLLDEHLWYLEPHMYSCPHCMMYQGKVYADIEGLGYPLKQVAIEGGVGHPNCKHIWSTYYGPEQLQSNNYNSPEWEEKYKIKQKIQSLDLKKSRLLTDRRIYKELEQQDLVDKTSAKIKRIREEKKELEAQM